VRKRDILHACQDGSFLLCACLAWQVTSGYEGTEFSGGWLTGPLLSMEEIGTVLFILAIVLTFVFPRVAAAIGLVASVLCLPLYFFISSLLLLSHFAQVFARGHVFKVEPVPGFHWDIWPVAGLFALAVEILDLQNDGNESKRLATRRLRLRASSDSSSFVLRCSYFRCLRTKV
jgi:hypothetical protein